MHISVITVGKTDIPWVKAGLDIYVSRLKHYVPFDWLELPELRNVSSLSRDQIKLKEGELLLKAFKASDEVILLDEHGKKYRSTEFASMMDKKLSGAGKDIIFVVGGAYGFSDAVYSRADGRLSLSDMTFSHQMVRTIFAEQLYRAFTIIRGEPYHHE